LQLGTVAGFHSFGTVASIAYSMGAVTILAVLHHAHLAQLVVEQEIVADA